MVCAFMISTPHAHCLFAARVGTPGSWHSEWSGRWGVGNIFGLERTVTRCPNGAGPTTAKVPGTMVGRCAGGHRATGRELSRMAQPSW